VARKQGLSDLDESLASDLTPVEKYLLDKQELMSVRGKVIWSSYIYFIINCVLHFFTNMLLCVLS